MELTKVFVVSVVLHISVVMVSTADCRPSYDGWLYHSRAETQSRRIAFNDCENSNEVRELCQRCAKVTKSRLAYPMCCERRENTREWCMKFLNFGLSVQP